MERRERTVFDGLEPNDDLIPRTVTLSAEIIEGYEVSLAVVDKIINEATRLREAWVRRISDARDALAKAGT
ncbi:hypothetical protein [Caudoviricetes sp.]|nr:hypothetical protein [Caudoviricetes sp.]